MKKSLGFLFCSILVATAKEKPNIVVIMADDLGLGDVSYHVRKQQKKKPLFETPNLDALAKESLWFTDGHSATSLCSPTRYCIMSGNNNYRSNAFWGVWGTFRETAFKKGEATLGSVVQKAGYKTGFIGKWHLGGDFPTKKRKSSIYRGGTGKDSLKKVDLTKMVGGGPKDNGFDYDFTVPCGIQGPVYTVYENQNWYPLSKDSEIIFFDKDSAIHPKDITSKGPGPGDSAWDSRELGKLISEKAVNFIKEEAGKKPFFLYYCSHSVHVPHCPPDEFDGKKVKGTTPSAHLDMVVEFDLQVKRIIDALKETGVYDNTLIIVTSDNGGLGVDKDTRSSGHRSSGGWAGHKNSPLEGGHRVPFFAVWKDHIKPGFTDEPAINQDLLATLASLVGTSYPDDEAQDSNNLLPLLTGRGTFKQREYLMQQAGSQKEVLFRKQNWKLIMQSDNKLSKFEPIALYNLEENPTENPKKNMVKSSKHKKVVELMRKEYMGILESKERTAPLNNK